MIWKNFVRDLRRTASRLISVSIITMIAVMVYTALSGILTNIERISASYLEGQNVADYWLTGVNLDQGDCRTLDGIAGVTGVQPRVVLDAEERHDSGVTLQLYAVPGDYAINTPYVVEGRLPESSREIVLSDTLARARGLDARQVLAMVGLGDRLNNFPAQCSGGEQQRGAIARALAKNPDVLLCDEPTGALDYQTGKAILALLYDLCKKSRKTVVVVTHNGALAPTADVLIRMKSGKIESFEENPSPVPVQELEW